MRTTIRLDEHLLTEAKRYAAESGQTLTAVIEDALRASLARRDLSPSRTPVRLKTVGRNGLQSGMDLDDSSALLDTMES
jgi:hypothetical protein